MSRARAAIALALAALLVSAGLANGAQTRSQRFFTEKLLDDRATSSRIKSLLRSGGGFVDRSIAFRDLTGDRKTDAIVRVQSGGASGAVAVFVFSTAGGKELRAVFRSQNLTRASTHFPKRTVLVYRTSRYAAGDELCCPSRIIETRLRWDREDKRFRVSERDELSPAASPTPTPTVTPTP